MFCPSCGKEVVDGQKFCPNCGNTMNGAVSVKKKAPVWESKVVQVAPSGEDYMIKEFQAFGWELGNSQTIDKQDSHLENRFGTVYSVTESEKYVKLTFKRNKAMDNYARIAELEEMYYDAEINYPDGAFSGKGWALGLSFLFFWPLCIYLIIKYIKEHKDAVAYYNSVKDEREQIRKACLEEADRLING